MTSAQVVETSVTNNSSFQNYPHPDNHTCTIRTNGSVCSPFWKLTVKWSGASSVVSILMM